MRVKDTQIFKTNQILSITLSKEKCVLKVIKISFKLFSNLLDVFRIEFHICFQYFTCKHFQIDIQIFYTTHHTKVYIWYMNRVRDRQLIDVYVAFSPGNEILLHNQIRIIMFVLPPNCRSYQFLSIKVQPIYSITINTNLYFQQSFQ